MKLLGVPQIHPEYPSDTLQSKYALLLGFDQKVVITPWHASCMPGRSGVTEEQEAFVLDWTLAS